LCDNRPIHLSYDNAQSLQQLTYQADAMPGSIRIGHFRDIYIDIHVTFLPVLLWAAWLGAIQYGGLNGALFGILAVLLLFGCVLLHEIAHSVQASACGVGVQYIVLLPIGGLASLDTASVKPRDEARIALVGPLMNLGLGVLFGAAVLGAALSNAEDVRALAFQSLQQPSLLGLLTYLSMANLMLAIFNLLPAFPLDGGRALRAFLSLRMPYEVATHHAAVAGRAFSIALAVIGVVQAAFGGPIGGLSLVVVATVLYGGATYEDRVTRRHAALHSWTVGQVVQAAVQTVSPSEPLSVALGSLAKGRVVPVVVGDQAKLIGLVTANELRQLSEQEGFGEISVAHVMRTRFPSVRSTDPLWVAYEKLQRSHLFAIPVVHRNNLCGLVSLTDIRQVLRNGAPPQPATT
jgi:Zn-dependent protease/CBS domain-containing protein